MSVLKFCVKTLFYVTLPIFQSTDKIQQSNQKTSTSRNAKITGQKLLLLKEAKEDYS